LGGGLLGFKMVVVETPVPTKVEVGLVPLGVFLLLFFTGAVVFCVTMLIRKKVERPLYLSLLVFGIAIMVFAAVGLSRPLVDVLSVYSSGSSEESGE
jgi:uncharacterized membrane protein